MKRQTKLKARADDRGRRGKGNVDESRLNIRSIFGNLDVNRLIRRLTIVDGDRMKLIDISGEKIRRVKMQRRPMTLMFKMKSQCHR